MGVYKIWLFQHLVRAIPNSKSHKCQWRSRCLSSSLTLLKSYSNLTHRVIIRVPQLDCPQWAEWPIQERWWTSRQHPWPAIWQKRYVNVSSSARLSHTIIALARNSLILVRHQSRISPTHSLESHQVTASRHTSSRRGKRQEISKFLPISTQPTFEKNSKEHCRTAFVQPKKRNSRTSDPRSRSRHWVTFMQRRWRLVTASLKSWIRKSWKMTRTW